jgi:hypothetical protein
VAQPTFAVHAGAAWSVGYVPPFRAGARDRGTAGLAGVMRVAPFEVHARWNWLSDTTPAGTVISLRK